MPCSTLSKTTGNVGVAVMLAGGGRGADPIMSRHRRHRFMPVKRTFSFHYSSSSSKRSFATYVNAGKCQHGDSIVTAQASVHGCWWSCRFPGECLLVGVFVDLQSALVYVVLPCTSRGGGGVCVLDLTMVAGTCASRYNTLQKAVTTHSPAAQPLRCV